MKTLSLFSGVFFLAVACRAASNCPAGQHFGAGFAEWPVTFEANRGQAGPAVEFLAHGLNGNLLLTRGETWVMLRQASQEAEPRRLRLGLAHAQGDSVPRGLDPLPGKANYLLGNDARLWHTNVPTFARVKYPDVYPGVDLIYYGNQQELEYDLVVRPGANPNDIVLEFSGAESISLDANGDLLLRLGDEFFRQRKPVVYQELGGGRKILSGNYVLHSAMQVELEIADYDKTKPLIIDPVLALSTTFGGSGFNQGLGIALDTNENVYVTGITTAGDFPTFNPFQTNKLGAYSAYVVKFNTNGAVVYSTFLGGGVLNDQTTTATSGQGIAVDGNGDAFVTGYTSATNFPLKNAFQTHKAALSYSGRNAFVTELNPAGDGLIYSTYLGGSNSDTATGIALDTNGDAIITGYTSSTNFPTVNAAQPVYGANGDAFVAKLSADGSALVYSTFLGGSSYENNDTSTGTAIPIGAVAVDFAGNAYVTGLTYSTNFPVLNALQPTNATAYYGSFSAAFVTKLDPAGKLVYSTYFGGQYGDTGRAIGVDFRGNVYFAGNSAYGDLPPTNAFQSSFGGRGAASLGDGFVAALDGTGTNLIYCTYLGGSGDDQVNGIVVRPDDGAVAVTGFTDSPNFPLLNAVQPAGEQGLFTSANGSTTWNVSNTGLASGVIYSIQFDPSNPMMVFALTANGCFESTDGGVDWTAASSGLGSVYPSSYGSPASQLAIDPLHPGTLYIGGYAGVYKTTNGAANWTLTSSGLPSNPWVQTLAVDPKVPTTLYAGTYFNGIFKSTNGGSTWNIATNGLNTLNCDALVVDPNNSSNVYAGGGNYNFSVSLYKSTNGGGNWTLLGGGLHGGAVNVLTASSSNLYAVVGNSLSYPPGSTPALQISTNGGLTWSSLLAGGGLGFTALAIAPPATPVLTIARAGANDLVSWPASFNGYTLQFTPSLNPTNWQNVAPTPALLNGNEVVTNPMTGAQGYYRLISTTNSSSPPTLYLGTDSASGQGVLKSTDGGNSWNVTGPAGDTINALAVNPAVPATVYAGLNGGRDAFITTLSPRGQLEFSTYLGGSGADQANAITADFLNAYVIGNTLSGDFPTTAVPAANSGSKNAPPNVKPLGESPAGRITGSDAPVLLGAVMRALYPDAFPCPQSTTNKITINVNEINEIPNIALLPTSVNVSVSGLPPGMYKSVTGVPSFSGGFGFVGILIFLDGTPNADDVGNTYNTVFHFEEGYCAWTKTYIITVTQY